MAVLKPKKRIAKRRQESDSSRFDSIPKELLTEILARVSSSSATDLFNAKKTSKEFYEAASDDHIFKHIAISSFPVIPWDPKPDASAFLEKCKKLGNPESLFRQGMVDYFSSLEHDSELEYLKRASDKGHPVASYVYGIILMCYGGGLRKQGLKLLIELTKKSTSIVNECREKVRKVVKEIWVDNYIVGIGPKEVEELKNKLKNCDCNNGKRRLLRLTDYAPDERLPSSYSGWKLSLDEEFEEDGNFSCQSCLWDLEASRFCHLIRTKSYFRCPFV